jgi:hypothetical protein
MTSKLFWVVVLSTAICIGVLKRGRVTRWIYYKQAEARWRITPENVPFVDYEGCTPTVEEIADRLVRKYTERDYLSFDVDTYMYWQLWQSHTRYLAAAGKTKRVVHIYRLSIFGRGTEKFAFTLRTLPDRVSEECVLANDGTRLATSYASEGHPTFRLADRVSGYVCPMGETGLFDSPIRNPEQTFVKLDLSRIREDKLLGTVLFDGQRCAVFYYVNHSSTRAVLNVVSPDYYLLQQNVYEFGDLARVRCYSNFSNAPIPDEEFE